MGKILKVMVYNLEDPDLKEFFVGVNGTRINGPVGKEIDMDEQMVAVLEDAIIDTTVRNPETNKEEPFRKERFKVIRLGVVSDPEADAAAAGSGATDSLDPERMAKIKTAINSIPAESYGQPAGGRPAMPKVGDVSAATGFKVSAAEIVVAMAMTE